MIPKEAALLYPSLSMMSQHKAACLIGGAFNTTATATPNAELYLMAMQILLERMVNETAIRLLTGPGRGWPYCIRPTTGLR